VQQSPTQQQGNVMQTVVEQPRDARDNVLTSPVGTGPKLPSHTGHGVPEQVETGTRAIGEGVRPTIPTNTGHEKDHDQDIIQTMFESRGDGLIPGTPEHKSDRWRRYQERNGPWSYEHWSNVYNSNMPKASKANAAVDVYQETIGWGKREVTVDAGGASRRLDIADERTRRGIEYKTGYQIATPEILSEVERDAYLVESGWDIEWVFEGRASEPLLEALQKANIKYKFR
jgi:hypothetical protein